MVLNIWDYTTSEMYEILLRYYTESGEWTLLSAEASINKEYGNAGLNAVNFILKIQRKVTYVVLVVILPVALLIVLNPLVFLLHTESG